MDAPLEVSKDIALCIENTASDHFNNREVPTDLTLWQATKRWPKVTLYCLALTSGVLLWGYDAAMAGNLAALDQFKYDYGVLHGKKWIIPSKWLGGWNATGPLGTMLGAIISGACLDRYGRRINLAAGSLTTAVGVAIIWVSQYASREARPGVFMLGKIVMGTSLGVVVTTTQTYISEVLPSVLRGPIIAFFPLFYLFGQLISAIVAFAAEKKEGPAAYRLCLISMWPFAALPLLCAAMMPESPVYLIRRMMLGRAFQAQKRLDTNKDDTQANVNQTRAWIIHEQEAAQSDRSRYVDCFRGTDKRRTLIVIFATIIPQLFGLPILGDGPYFLQVTGMNSRNSLIYLMTGIAGGIVSTIISMWLLTRFGRRPLSLVTPTILSFLWLGMGVAGCFEAEPVPWFVGATLNTAVAVAALGVWPASYVVASETSSLRLRAKTQGIGWACHSVANLVFSLIPPFIYNTDAGNLRAKIGFVWAAIAGLGTVLFYFIVPEMLHRTPLQLDLMFEQKTPTRMFCAWQGHGIEQAIVAEVDGKQDRE
ncbi:hypothetical protein LTR84_007037 [Exophiala bonariae]|uniref:Major facilitator superfamily (MFS) profile domain-containing protein n=1 Tax=Exophiala bonariae TaxID=1690606 RepID=A0AAV9N239_9EURO|nr:hypothetical protein LTR84_007037 [Exophiala bonariae]